MKKLISLLLTLGLFCSIGFFEMAKCAEKAGKNVVVDFEYQTTDKFLVQSKLIYPEAKKTAYPLVVLLHSLGYSSAYWGSVITKFNQAGFAVLAIDFKGHGKSIKDIYFKQKSWIYLTDKSFKLLPTEVAEILKQVKASKKEISLENTIYIGADLGANTAIITAQEQPYKQRPHCLVLISPSMEFKGLYTPVKLADTGNVPVMAIASAKDRYSLKQVGELKKYAQGPYTIKTYPQGGTGMLMLKTNPTMPSDIVSWAVTNFNKK